MTIDGRRHVDPGPPLPVPKPGRSQATAPIPIPPQPPRPVSPPRPRQPLCPNPGPEDSSVSTMKKLNTILTKLTGPSLSRPIFESFDYIKEQCRIRPEFMWNDDDRASDQFGGSLPNLSTTGQSTRSTSLDHSSSRSSSTLQSSNESSPRSSPIAQSKRGRSKSAGKASAVFQRIRRVAARPLLKVSRKVQPASARRKSTGRAANILQRLKRIAGGSLPNLTAIVPSKKVRSKSAGHTSRRTSRILQKLKRVTRPLTTTVQTARAIGRGPRLFRRIRRSVARHFPGTRNAQRAAPQAQERPAWSMLQNATLDRVRTFFNNANTLFKN